jgi:electron transfer flavoprotein alpha subunit
MRVAALVKQIPEFEQMRLGPEGRLERAGLPLEMSAYCRRAVAKGVEIAHTTGGTCTVFTLGPPSAEDVLREAIAYGADEGVHISDPAFAGSDTLATARALARAIEATGPYDLILVGRSSVDADTGQVGPELAQLLDLPFATGVKQLELRDGEVDVGLELDDEWVDATVVLPAVLSAAERLIDPCKIKDPSVWETVDAARIRRLRASDLGDGPWGQDGSPTHVGETRAEVVDRVGLRLEGPVEQQVARTVEFLKDRGALLPDSVSTADELVADAVPETNGRGPLVGVVSEPDRPRLTRELLGGAARLASQLGGRVTVIGTQLDGPDALASWGADHAVLVRGALADEDFAVAVARWAANEQPWAVLAGSTAFGREVASRVAASLGAGLTGDAVGLAVDDGRLVAWKPAFGGTLVAAITATSSVQMATVRPGVLSLLQPRRPRVIEPSTIDVQPRGRVHIRSRRREDDIDALANAEIVIGVGLGVDPSEYGALEGLREVLRGEFAATRKVTDKGWMPHARQIGITGHAIAPRLYFALGMSGKYNHTVGVRSAGTIVAVNPDPDAPVFGFADIGIVGDWHEVIPELERQLRALLG